MDVNKQVKRWFRVPVVVGLCTITTSYFWLGYTSHADSRAYFIIGFLLAMLAAGAFVEAMVVVYLFGLRLFIRGGKRVIEIASDLNEEDQRDDLIRKSGT